MSDKAHVLYELFVEELANIARIRSDDLAVILSELSDELGEIDPDILNKAEERAVARYKREYRHLLGPLDDEDWEAFDNIIWKEGGAGLPNVPKEEVRWRRMDHPGGVTQWWTESPPHPLIKKVEVVRYADGTVMVYIHYWGDIKPIDPVSKLMLGYRSPDWEPPEDWQILLPAHFRG